MALSWDACKDALVAAYHERPAWYKELAVIIYKWYQQGLIDLPRGKVSWVDININERAALKARIDEVTEDGMFAIVRAGMDCDGTQYRRVSHHVTIHNIFKFHQKEMEHEDALDGVEQTWFQKPSEEEPSYKSRDRALEAYENGHPSRLVMGAL